MINLNDNPVGELTYFHDTSEASILSGDVSSACEDNLSFIIKQRAVLIDNLIWVSQAPSENEAT